VAVKKTEMQILADQVMAAMDVYVERAVKKHMGTTKSAPETEGNIADLAAAVVALAARVQALERK
jgi:hypothetical protein